MAIADISTRIPPSTPALDLAGTNAAELEFKQTTQDQIAFHGFSRVILTSLPLAAVDALTAVTALTLAAGSIALFGWQLPIQLGGLAAALVLSTLIANYFFGLYPGVGLNPSAELRSLTFSTSVIYAVFLANCLIQSNRDLQGLQPVLLISWGFTLIAAPLFRWGTREVCGRFSWWGEPILIFGHGVQSHDLYHYFRGHPGRGLKPWGILSAESVREWECDDDIYIGQPQEATLLARQYGISWAIIAAADMRKEQIARYGALCAPAIPNQLVVTDFGDLPSMWNRTHDCGGAAGIQVTERLLLPVPRFLKRGMDLGLALGVAILFAPLLTVLAILVKFSSPGPIFFGQTRIGRNGQTFKAWKFRSMIPNADAALKEYLAANPAAREEFAATQKLRHDPRITRVGEFLRKTSLDELPQLWNVINGDMSLVGPRPIVNDEIARYADVYRLYCRVRPGITGLWQVSGRSLTTYEERVRLDSRYVRNWSPWLDLYILVRTVKTVLFREGAF